MTTSKGVLIFGRERACNFRVAYMESEKLAVTKNDLVCIFGDIKSRRYDGKDYQLTAP